VHGTPDYNYTPPGGGTPTPYNAFSACLNIRSGSYIDLGGNDLDTCGLGMYSQDNATNEWASITHLVTLMLVAAGGGAILAEWSGPDRH